jgi:hypothetical protein
MTAQQPQHYNKSIIYFSTLEYAPSQLIPIALYRTLIGVGRPIDAKVNRIKFKCITGRLISNLITFPKEHITNYWFFSLIHRTILQFNEASPKKLTVIKWDHTVALFFTVIVIYTLESWHGLLLVHVPQPPKYSQKIIQLVS